MGDKLAISICDLKDGDMPLLERIDVALRRITRNEGQMRIPPEATDVDMVLCSCRDRIAGLTAQLAEARVDIPTADAETWRRACNEARAEVERLRPAAEAWEAWEAWRIHDGRDQVGLAKLYERRNTTAARAREAAKVKA